MSDSELAEMLGVGLSTARRIADESGAVRRYGKIKRNCVEDIKKYIRATAE